MSQPGDGHAAEQAFADRLLAVALHLEDVPIHFVRFRLFGFWRRARCSAAGSASAAGGFGGAARRPGALQGAAGGASVGSGAMRSALGRGGRRLGGGANRLAPAADRCLGRDRLGHAFSRRRLLGGIERRRSSATPGAIVGRLLVRIVLVCRLTNTVLLLQNRPAA